MYACAFCFDWCTQLIIFYCVLRHENLFARQRDCDEDDIDDDNVEWMKRRKKIENEQNNEPNIYI